ncbi:MAG: AarF/ABC1/UbiB kinase family protein, partial [Solirubrobacterales bacterium]|nr:AarF/ABC1/UbiB kinase family protein [Solirubrobacterales bacterium]
MAETDALTQLDTLVQVALRIAASAASGRIALAKLAANLEPSWLPAPWDKTVWPELQRALEARPEPLAFSVIKGVLAEADVELDSLEREPVAVRWTSQVHRGVYDGRAVAVKVLRPGLAASVRQDLVLLDGLLAPLANAFPGADIHGLLGEARERVMDEFDLDNEASLQRRFWRALRRSDLVVVPEPLTALSHEQVLVSEWIDGKSLSSGGSFGFATAAGTLLRFVLGGIRAGLMHCDLDADDVLVLEDGRLAVLDYGAVAVVAEERADQCLAVVEAF